MAQLSFSLYWALTNYGFRLTGVVVPYSVTTRFLALSMQTIVIEPSFSRV